MRRFGSFVTCIGAVALISTLGAISIAYSTSTTEAPTGFSTPTLHENPGSQSVSNGMTEPAGDTFADDQAAFEEQDGNDNGLGPLYNAQSCVNCHQNPVTGGTSQVTELRVGHKQDGQFVNPSITINGGTVTISNRSLINDRALCPEAQERVPDTETIRAQRASLNVLATASSRPWTMPHSAAAMPLSVASSTASTKPSPRTFNDRALCPEAQERVPDTETIQRASLNVLGDGFVEAVDDATLSGIAAGQPGQSNGYIAGEFIQVPLLEASGQTRGGRFGWKNQHASLLSFSSDAYINEQGISNRLSPVDTTTVCKTTTDPEDQTDSNGLADIDHFAQFIRATLAPPVDSVLQAGSDAQDGLTQFNSVGCSICHVATLTTLPQGTLINGGTYAVPAALGSVTFHPYSDFLLHDVGTGDGIVQNGPSDTANKLRTPPLWGLRTRSRLMHDLQTFSRKDAILRHGKEAAQVITNYRALSKKKKDHLLTFLDSL